MQTSLLNGISFSLWLKYAQKVICQVLGFATGIYTGGICDSSIFVLIFMCKKCQN